MKKFMKILLVSIIAFALVACGAKEGDKGGETGQTYELSLWGSQDDQELLAELVEAFKATDPDNTYNITLGVVGEPDARDKVLEDLDASADVFAFPNDQIRELVDAGALYEITLNKAEITAANQEGSIEAVTLDGAMYGIPFTADNGYFLYYDSNVFTAEDVETLEGLAAKAAENGTKVFVPVSNSWYIASFFLGAGNTIKYEDGKQIVDFNNETGLKVGEYIRELLKSPGVIAGLTDEEFMAGVADGSISAGWSGTWTASQFQEAYGDGYAATKLPTINLDGVTTQLGSFGGYKVYGINSATKHPEQAMALAEFLSNESSQARRFELRNIGPSNLVVGASDAVLADKALAALAAQGVYAVSQKDVTGSYWTPAEAFGTELVNGYSGDMQALLDEMVSQINQ